MFTGGTIWILTHSHLRSSSGVRGKKQPQDGEAAVKAEWILVARIECLLNALKMEDVGPRCVGSVGPAALGPWSKCEEVGPGCGSSLAHLKLPASLFAKLAYISLRCPRCLYFTRLARAASPCRDVLPASMPGCSFRMRRSTRASPPANRKATPLTPWHRGPQPFHPQNCL